MARTYCSAALLLLFLAGALANDVILEFKVLDCYDNPVAGVKVTVNKCQDNQLVGNTNGSGIVRFDSYPSVVMFCNGASREMCEWSAVDVDGVEYSGDISTLMNLTQGTTGAFTSSPISPNKWVGCQCNGQDDCAPAYTYPQIVLRPKKESCPCDSKCPAVCYAQVGGRDSNLYMQGQCSSSFAQAEPKVPRRYLLTRVDDNKCPEGFMDSGSPCKEGADCGVCCIENPVCRR